MKCNVDLFSEKSLMKLQIDIQFDSKTEIRPGNLEVAIKCGIKEVDATDINTYIVAFLSKLLLLREKLGKRMLEHYLIPAITKQWQEMLSSLEERNRKLINIQNGSLIFLLFCPTRESRRQLQDENWRRDIQKKLAELLKVLGKF